MGGTLRTERRLQAGIQHINSSGAYIENPNLIRYGNDWLEHWYIQKANETSMEEESDRAELPEVVREY